LDAIAEEHEDAFRAMMAGTFEYDNRHIQAIIKGAEIRSRNRKGTLSWAYISRAITEYYKGIGDEYLAQNFLKVGSALFDDTADSWAMHFGAQFSLRPILAEKWFIDYALKFSSPITKTSSVVMSDVIAQGLKEGWSIPELQTQINMLTQQWAFGNVDPTDTAWALERLPIYRSEMIARTETIRAVNAGSMALGKRLNAKKKEWLATTDDRTRPSHLEADGSVVDIDEPFLIGNYDMMYPGDAEYGAPPSEFVNCRCCVLILDPDLENITESDINQTISEPQVVSKPVQPKPKPKPSGSYLPEPTTDPSYIPSSNCDPRRVSSWGRMGTPRDIWPDSNTFQAMQKHYRAAIDTLTDEERRHIYKYTNSFDRIWNRYLREGKFYDVYHSGHWGDIHLNKEIVEDGIDELSRILGSFEPLSEPVVVRRAIEDAEFWGWDALSDADFIELGKSAQVVEEKGFLSTTLQQPWDTRYELVINAPEGLEGGYINFRDTTKYMSEHEWLVNKNIKMEVVHTEMVGRKRIAYLNIIEQNGRSFLPQ